MLELLNGQYNHQFIGGAMSLTLLTFMEVIVVGNAVANNKGYEINPNQELLALGLQL